jgi:hypothetical protein
MSEEFSKYKDKLSKDQKDILDKLLQKHTDECEKLFFKEIQLDREHSTIVNMIAYAFSEVGPLSSTGYHFITVDPLYKYRGEKGNKIFDIVLYNRESKRAIMIECKSSIGKAHRDVIVPATDQVENTNNHHHELEEEIGGEIKDLEYVVCGISQDIEEVCKILKDEPLCLLTVDLFRFTIKLFNLTGSLDGNQTGRLIQKRQLHIDAEFRKRLFEKTESRGQIEGFKIAPSSHMCRILSRVFERILQRVSSASNNQEKRFWLHEMKEIVREELPRIDAADADRITKEVYDLAISLKIIEAEKTVDEKQGIAFNLKLMSKSARTIEKEIVERYTKEKCKERSPKLALEEYQKFVETSPSSLDYHFKNKT